MPNSYLYRFTPSDKTDLTKGGKLQALQVSRPDGSPITASQLSSNPADPVITDLHTYGRSFATTWVTVHDGADVFDATASAAAADATPFKRPENGVFRPGTGFGEFYFTETGDTSATSTLPGAYGAVFRLSQASPTADKGKLSPVVVGDQTHTGFDNIAFATKDQLLVVEDAGDLLHAQRDALDSGYLVNLDGKDGRAKEITRWLAEGRDASALCMTRRPAPATTTGTTRSPASTSRTATPRSVAFSAPRRPAPSTAAGGCSGPSSTETTSPGRSPVSGNRVTTTRATAMATATAIQQPMATATANTERHQGYSSTDEPLRSSCVRGRLVRPHPRAAQVTCRSHTPLGQGERAGAPTLAR